MTGLVNRLRAASINARYAGRIWKRLGGVYPRECNICGYSGLFNAHGLPPRFDARCPACNSLERHRHQVLWISRLTDAVRGKRVLHFAPEPSCADITAPWRRRTRRRTSPRGARTRP